MIQRVDYRISQREVFDRTLRFVYAERESDRLRGVALLVILLVRDNALLLSVAAQFNESVSVEIMGWLANTTIVLGSSDERIWEMAIAQIDDPSMKRRIVEFARFADFGIDDIRKVDNTVISSHRDAFVELCCHGKK